MPGECAAPVAGHFSRRSVPRTSASSPYHMISLPEHAKYPTLPYAYRAYHEVRSEILKRATERRTCPAGSGKGPGLSPATVLRGERPGWHRPGDHRPSRFARAPRSDTWRGRGAGPMGIARRASYVTTVLRSRSPRGVTGSRHCTRPAWVVADTVPATADSPPLRRSPGRRPFFSTLPPVDTWRGQKSAYLS